MKKPRFWEIIGDGLLIAFGAVLIFIFITIEVLGQYGQETNQWLRWLELFMGLPIMWIGIDRFLEDIKRK